MIQITITAASIINHSNFNHNYHIAIIHIAIHIVIHIVVHIVIADIT